MKAFIDCGCYKGKAFRLFKRTKEYSDDLFYYAFDPFSSCKDENINFQKKAVWVFDGELEMYKSSRRGGQANSIYSNKRAKNEQEVKVECIDFSSWVKNTFSKDDYLVLKMDIEGAEYEVIKKMYEDETLHYFDVAYIEPHYPKDIDHPFFPLREKIKKEIPTLSLRTSIEWCWEKYQ